MAKEKKSLVIVESPTKAKTISKILGKDFAVIPSMGHLIDLPQRKLGVDVENGFEPAYVVIKGRKKLLAQLKKESKGKDAVYMATDPDREGEAIGWNIKSWAFKNKEVSRVVFHEITASAVKTAFEHAREFNQNMIQAQIGRRVLDRIVGYMLSPLLWKKIAPRLSAGRVQSVALRLIVERERQIRSFIPQEYWEIEAELKKNTIAPESPGTGLFAAKLDKIEDKKVEIKTKEDADGIVNDLAGKSFSVADIKEREKKRFPDPPFITSTLQQDSFNKLKFSATRTMILAQQLYEGIDIGEEGPVGLITYMRTDSTHVAPEAIKEVRGFIGEKFGKDYLPETPNVYKVKKFAQEAHEAIRPTFVPNTPEKMKHYLDEDQYRLYELIYNRFVASQMTPARSLVVTVTINAEKYLFSVSGTTPVFEGFTALYKKNEEEEAEKKKLPPLTKGELLDLVRVLPSQHFTKPPPRFSDSSLIKLLEEEGIGRPSTYAPIIHTLVMRDYVQRIKGYFHPTELGEKVCDLLVTYFPKVMDVKFTAQLEEKLDGIEDGSTDRVKVLQEFYDPFKAGVEFAQNNVQKEVITTDQVCDKCGKPMVIKWGRKGKFLSCSAFPECKNSKSITSGVQCPAPGCAGELIQRRSKRGVFYGCSAYPACTFISKTLPEPKES
ncbi:MAG: type I DNA topoisomerase [Candidatus Omnitrophota bacterium]|jgi:DNA topoisomerase-1